MKKKKTYEDAVAERNAEYREIAKATPTSSLIRMIIDEGQGRGLHHWQERIVDDELDARIPTRKP